MKPSINQYIAWSNLILQLKSIPAEHRALFKRALKCFVEIRRRLTEKGLP
jgi:hypothetical protein